MEKLAVLYGALNAEEGPSHARGVKYLEEMAGGHRGLGAWVPFLNWHATSAPIFLIPEDALYDFHASTVGSAILKVSLRAPRA